MTRLLVCRIIGNCRQFPISHLLGSERRELTLANQERIVLSLDRFSHCGLRSFRDRRQLRSPHSYPGVVPFTQNGSGPWTGHPVGWFIMAAFILIAAIGIPGAPPFVFVLLGMSALLGCALRFWHRSSLQTEAGSLRTSAVTPFYRDLAVQSANLRP